MKGPQLLVLIAILHWVLFIFKRMVLDVISPLLNQVGCVLSLDFCRQSIESGICRKAVNGFCSAFKEQITDLVSI